MTRRSAEPRTERGRKLKLLGLRSRVTMAFALGAAVLSGALALATYGLAYHYLLAQKVKTVQSQAFSDARVLKQTLDASPNAPVSGSLSSVMPGHGTRSLLFKDGTWYSTSVSVGNHSLPASLVQEVLAGNAAMQRTVIDGKAMLAVGVPIPSVDSSFFEIQPLTELKSTLYLLEVVLAIVAATIAVGGTFLGRWASSHLFRPLREVTSVAGEIGRGDLGRRMPTSTDRDLDPLVTSFNSMVDALHQRIERDARFASDVSHELRSPLTAVQASVELLVMFRACLPPEGETALDLVSMETSRFSETLASLLEISRMDAGAMDLVLDEVPLDELVANSVTIYSHESVPVEVDPSAHEVLVRCDRRRIQRVLTNLLDNARMHAGGATAVRVMVAGDRAEITVEDAGPGVPVEERSRIFERFYRGRAASRRTDETGAGLGLALVAEHVRAHGGTVEVRQNPGGGARFVVSIPLDLETGSKGSASGAPWADLPSSSRSARNPA